MREAHAIQDTRNDATHSGLELFEIRDNFILTFRATRASRIFYPNIAIFSQFQVYLNITQATTNNKFISNFIFSNFCPVISYRRDREESDVVYGHSLWSANQLPAQRVKRNAAE